MSVAVPSLSRPLRGSRLDEFYPQIPAEVPSLSNLDSAFQLQEYISLLVRQNPHNVETIISNPGRPANSSGEKSEEGQEKEGKVDVVVDESSWIYEQLRRLAQDLTHPLITSLQQECTRATCPEMKAGEWLYLCVAHGQEGALEQCCAIDYIIHTLDSATALLNSPRAFPSRLSIPSSSLRHFPSLARRLGRIFAHAYFHHREIFEQAESESALYERFLALTERFSLVPAEFLVIPPRGQSESGNTDVEPPRLHGAAVFAGNMTTPEEEVDEKEKQEKGKGKTDAPESDSQPSGEGRLSVDAPSQPGRSLSPEKAAPTGLESPRKMGRHRTDTMILSDAAAISEELQRAAGTGLRGSPASSGAGALAASTDQGKKVWEDTSILSVVETVDEPKEESSIGEPLSIEKREPEPEPEMASDIKETEGEKTESSEERAPADSEAKDVDDSPVVPDDEQSAQQDIEEIDASTVIESNDDAGREGEQDASSEFIMVEDAEGVSNESQTEAPEVAEPSSSPLETSTSDDTLVETGELKEDPGVDGSKLEGQNDKEPPKPALEDDLSEQKVAQ